MARKKSKSNAITVDLSGVESISKLPEGTYGVTLIEASQEESTSGNPYIKMTFEINSGEYEGRKLYHNCSLLPQALFNLKSVLEALGMSIPKKAFELSLPDLIGLTCLVEVANEKYEGKIKSVITEFLSSEDDEESSSDLSELLEELDLSELRTLAKELGIKTKGKDEEDLREEILEEDEAEETYAELFGDSDDEEDEDDSDDGDSGEEDDDDEDDEEMDYSEMSLTELKAECKARGIKFPKEAKSKKLIQLLEEDDEE